MYEEIFLKLDASNQSANSHETQEQGKILFFELCKSLSENEVGELLNRNPSLHSSTMSVNIIEVLTMLGYPKIRRAIPWLLGFLEDTNWFGAEQAQGLLGILNPHSYNSELNKVLKKALSSNDKDWVCFISIFVE